MIQHSISKLSNKDNLSTQEITADMKEILDGKIADDDIAQFLKLLSMKGETNEELLGMLNEMQEFGVHISPKNRGMMIDVCGTGGDNLKTFNISTTASFVIAAAGGNVAKHGNRSVSGVSGSADIFEYFGYDLNATPERITEIIEKCKIGFMFAPKFHPAMKNVATARKIVNARTAFNLLGPLSNPAKVKNQMIGVFSDEYLERLPTILKLKGSQNIMTVRSIDGLDELSTTSKNKICLLKNGQIETSILDPQDLGLKKADLSEIQILRKEDSIKAFVNILNGTASKSMIEITALNAAGGLIVSNLANDFTEAIEIALNTINSGKSNDILESFLKECGDMQKLEEVKTIMKNVLEKLVENSHNAIKEGVYEISETLQQSTVDLSKEIKENPHASLITEIKFASPSLGKISELSDPVKIAKSMIKGGAKALSILTQPYLFNGSPELFMKVRKEIQVPLLMKDIIVDKSQIDAAKKIGADYIFINPIIV